jgi:hypothetical protein
MGDSLTFNVRVTNTTGHRFPTGYPSRRAWLHVRVLDAGGVVRFEWGAPTAWGASSTARATLLEAQRDMVRPHLQAITRDDQVQVYETVMVDVEGAVTHLPLRAARYLKDNRILPRGWRATTPTPPSPPPPGVEGDADFARARTSCASRSTTAGWVPRASRPSSSSRHPPTPRVVASARVDVP